MIQKIIESIVKEYEVGEICEGTVSRIAKFGAFVDLGGNNEGLVHISKISNKRIEKVEDVLAVGDTVKVRISEIDDQGKISLSMKEFETVTETEKED